MRNLLSLILIIFISVSCQEEEKKKITSPSNKKYNISLNFKNGAKKDYHSIITVSIKSAKFAGLTDSMKKDLLKFTNNKGFENATFQLITEFKRKIVNVKNKTGHLETSIKKITIKNLNLNEKPFPGFPIPYNFPISKKTVSEKLTNKGKLVNFENNKAVKTLLGKNQKNLLKSLIELVNSYQHLPEHDLAVGESWNSNINKTIYLNEMLPDGSLAIKFNIKNTLNKVHNKLFSIGYQFSGSVHLSVTLKDKKDETSLILKITLKNGLSDVVLDNNVGLIQSAKLNSDFTLHLEILSSENLGQPKVDISGNISYMLNTMNN